MRQLRFLALFLIAGAGVQATNSQCCCSGVDLRITDGAGVSLPAKDVKASVIHGKRSEGSIRAHGPDKDGSEFQFYVGCGVGTEGLAVEYMGVTMRIRFKLLGEFGRPKVGIPFAAGDHVAEFAKERDDEGRQTIVLRGATSEEMKEIEPPEPSDAPADQTAQTS